MLIPVTVPGALPIAMEEVIKHCRAPEDGFDDDLLETYLASAVAFAEFVTRRNIRQVTLQYRGETWPCDGRLVLPAAPVRDIEGVEYLDADAVLESVAGADYSWEHVPDGAVITFVAGWSAPTLHDRRRWPIRVTFAAGYDVAGASGSGVDPILKLPPQARTAILMLTAWMYEKREAASVDPTHKVALSAEALLHTIKVYR